MTKRTFGLHDSLAWINATICLCMIVQLGISYRLWLPVERGFPEVEAIPGLEAEFGLAGDILLLILMIGSLAGLLIAPFERTLTVLFLLVSALFIIEDISRFQPWLYLFALMLLVMMLHNPRRREPEAYALLSLIISGLYFWSGVQKLNHAFATEIAPWLAGAVGLDGIVGAVPWLAFIGPAVEIFVGLAFLSGKLRRPGAVAGILLHLLIILALGPWGHNWNMVIWPWNLAMAIVLGIMGFVPAKRDDAGENAPAGIRAILLLPRSPLLYASLLLMWLLPVLNYMGLWDSHLSGSLYSGNNSEAIFYFDEKDRGNLPESSRGFTYYHPGTSSEFILLDQWALQDMEAPFYPERRYFLALARKLCDCTEAPLQAGIKITVKKKFTSEQRLEEYRCEEIMREVSDRE